jgi:hypothetical protein
VSALNVQITSWVPIREDIEYAMLNASLINAMVRMDEGQASKMTEASSSKRVALAPSMKDDCLAGFHP